LIDENGNEVTSIMYDRIYYPSSDGLYSVEINNENFIINKKGECIYDCQNAPANHPKVE